MHIRSMDLFSVHFLTEKIQLKTQFHWLNFSNADKNNMVLRVSILIICSDDSSKNYARNMGKKTEKRIKLTFAWHNEALKAFKVGCLKLRGTMSIIIIILVLNFVRHAHFSMNHRLVRTFQTPFTPNKSNMFAFATMQTIERVSILESFNIVN